jgi:hypothetical protein
MEFLLILMVLALIAAIALGVGDHLYWQSHQPSRIRVEVPRRPQPLPSWAKARA